MSAFGSLSTESSGLTTMTGGLASWWGSLDPPSQPKRNEMQERVQASSKVGRGDPSESDIREPEGDAGK